MNHVNNILQRHTNHVMDVLDRITEVSEAAEDVDEAGRWGVDGWIQLIHDLIDMQIRYAASITESVIEGPFWGGGRAPFESDLLRARRATTYERRFEINDRFSAVGKRGIEIPEDLLEFDPPTLPAGEVWFRVRLKTDEPQRTAVYYGANYVGRIEFLPVDGREIPPLMQGQPQTFTIGL